MTEGKASDAQRRATKKWEERNSYKKRYLSHRSNARTFVRHWAKKEDIQELIEIFNKENENAKKEG